MSQIEQTGIADAKEYRGRKSRSRLAEPLRFFLLAGIIGPILFILVFTVDGSLTKGYSPLEQAISALGAVGLPFAWVQNTNFIVFGLSLMAFAIGFCWRMRDVLGRGWRSACTGLFLLTGLAMAASGIFRLGSSPLIETLHLSGFIVVFSSLLSVLFLLAVLWWQIPAWRGTGRYTLVSALLTVGAFIALATVANPLSLGGLFQRLLVLCAFSWYVVMGFWLFARNGNQGG
jgi:hypothetical membrane protein